MNCYCGNNTEFAHCCLPFISGESLPPTPEALMRSRYSAFCANQADYLVATHWPVTPNSKTTIQQTIDSTEWLGLNIIETAKIAKNDTQGFVEFVAFFNEQGIQQLHEKSQFKKIDNRWFYISGKQLPPIKLKRNDACFCGSGKKFKKCHGGQ